MSGDCSGAEAASSAGPHQAQWSGLAAQTNTSLMTGSRMFLAEPSCWDRARWQGAVRVLFKAYLLVDLSQGVSALIAALVSSVRPNQVSCCPGLLLGSYPEAQELWWHGWRYRKGSRVWWLVPGGVPRSSQVLCFAGGTWGLAGGDTLYCAKYRICVFLMLWIPEAVALITMLKWSEGWFLVFFLWSFGKLNLTQLSCKCINMGPLKTRGGIRFAVLRWKHQCRASRW